DNQSVLVPFVALAAQIAGETGAPYITPEVFQAADNRFCWTDGLRSDAYWGKVVRDLSAGK
ncbi:MAG: hypothetical protein IJ088_06390, partial [Clostridia bacterium]|nr:hypothetical protein [Clostridia bacterium]